jgi:hypothetical protein
MVEVGFYTIVARVYHVKTYPMHMYLSVGISCEMTNFGNNGGWERSLFEETVPSSP